MRKDNAMLKADVEALQKRLAAAERALQLRKDQDQHLRDSIFMARREVHRIYLDLTWSLTWGLLGSTRDGGLGDAATTPRAGNCGISRRKYRSASFAHSSFEPWA
jgi:hypothetical protein